MLEYIRKFSNKIFFYLKETKNWKYLLQISQGQLKILLKLMLFSAILLFMMCNSQEPTFFLYDFTKAFNEILNYLF